MEKLKTLHQLLEMTEEAKRLASEGLQTERVKSLVVEIRRIAQKEHQRLGGVQRQGESSIPTRYQLCMIGVREECNFGRAMTVPSIVDLSARFSRIHEEIDRTIKEIKASSRIM